MNELSPGQDSMHPTEITPSARALDVLRAKFKSKISLQTTNQRNNALRALKDIEGLDPNTAWQIITEYFKSLNDAYNKRKSPKTEHITASITLGNEETSDDYEL